MRSILILFFIFPSFAWSASPQEVKQDLEVFRERFQRDLIRAQFESGGMQFLEQILIPTLGKELMAPQVKWIIQRNQIQFTLPHFNFRIIWASKGKEPSVLNPNGLILPRFEWWDSQLAKKALERLGEVLAGTALQNPFEQNLKEWIVHVPYQPVKAVKKSNEKIYSDLKTKEGVLTFDELTRGLFILHPTHGMAKIVDKKSDGLLKLEIVRWGKYYKYRTYQTEVSNQKELLFARPGSPAFSTLRSWRARSFYPPKYFLGLWVYNLLYSRAFESKNSNLERIFKAEPYFQKYQNLKMFVREIGLELHQRGFKHNVKWQSYCEDLNYFSKKVLESTGEDLLVSGLLLDLEGYLDRAGEPNFIRTPTGREKASKANRELAFVFSDMDGYYREVGIRYGIAALDGKKELRTYPSKIGSPGEIDTILAQPSLEAIHHFVKNHSSELGQLIFSQDWDYVTYFPDAEGVAALFLEMTVHHFHLSRSKIFPFFMAQPLEGSLTRFSPFIRKLIHSTQVQGVGTSPLKAKLRGKRILVVVGPTRNFLLGDVLKRLLWDRGPIQVELLQISGGQRGVQKGSVSPGEDNRYRALIYPQQIEYIQPSLTTTEAERERFFRDFRDTKGESISGLVPRRLYHTLQRWCRDDKKWVIPTIQVLVKLLEQIPKMRIDFGGWVASQLRYLPQLPSEAELRPFAPFSMRAVENLRKLPDCAEQLKDYLTLKERRKRKNSSSD